MALAQLEHDVAQGAPVGHLGVAGAQHQQGGADDGFGLGAGVGQLVIVQPQVVGQPQGGFHELGGVAAACQLGPVVGQRAQGPLGQLRDVNVGELLAFVHAEVAGLRHDDQPLEHVGAALGARQETVVAQRFGGAAQVTLTAVFEVQAHEVDDAVAGALELGAQELAAEIGGDLHHAFGRAAADVVKLGLVDQAVLHAVLQGFFEERPGVVQRDASGWGERGVRHQMADSSSESSTTVVTRPKSVSLVSTLLPSSSSSSSNSGRPDSKARTLARSTSSISVNRSGHS